MKKNAALHFDENCKWLSENVRKQSTLRKHKEIIKYVRNYKENVKKSKRNHKVCQKNVRNRKKV